MSNLLLAMLDKLGIPTEKFGDSTGMISIEVSFGGGVLPGAACPPGSPFPLTFVPRSRQIASTSYNRPIGPRSPHSTSSGQAIFLARSASSCLRSIEAPAR